MKLTAKDNTEAFYFDSDEWFSAWIEAEDYEKAKKRYNKLLRKRTHKI